MSVFCVCCVLSSRGLGSTAAVKAYCTNPALKIPACTARSPHAYNARDHQQGKGELVPRNVGIVLPPNSEFHAIWRDLLHAANLRHGTDGFTSPPKEGMLRFFFCPEKSDVFGLVRTREIGYFALKIPTVSAGFELVNLGISPWKIWRLRSGSNPRTWVLEASMLT
jgi:hypothetical protein